MVTRYICVGCAEIHDDYDYNPSDGDIVLNEKTIKCLINFINKQYNRNLKEYPDARRSFELQQSMINTLKPKRECVNDMEDEQ